jgi:hypothetical protein
MDELLKALAEAVKAGTSMAMPALIGYFAMRVLELASVPTCIFVLSLGAVRVIGAAKKPDQGQLEAERLKFQRAVVERGDGSPEWAARTAEGFATSYGDCGPSVNRAKENRLRESVDLPRK